MAARPNGVSILVYNDSISIEKRSVLSGTVRLLIFINKVRCVLDVTGVEFR